MTTGFDYIVIGAGSAGCVLAGRLTEDATTRVALIEGGGSDVPDAVALPAKWPLLQGTGIDWGYRTVSQPACANRVHDWPRGRIIGGSSAINAMAHVRGHSSDFACWGRNGVYGWSFADLLPYFIKSETSPFGSSPLHGDDGPVHLITPDRPHAITTAYMGAALEQGLIPTDEHNGRQLTGPTLNTLTIKNGMRQTVADAYLTEEVLRRPNLSIFPDHLVDRLRLDGGAGRDVLAIHNSEEKTLRAKSGIVLCAGTVGSPAILQRSGIGEPASLKELGIPPVHPLPGVGENLHDHLLAGGNVYLARRPVQQSHYQHSESLTYIDLPGSAVAPEIAVACVVVPVTTECFSAPAVGQAYTLMFGVTHPRSRGHVRIVTADPFVSPRIDPQYLSDPYDRRTAAAALDWARCLGHSEALSCWRDKEVFPSSDDLSSTSKREAFIERAAYTHHHPVGTCRMGADDYAVVDSDLKVRGLEGVYVMDASVMPSIPTGPINAAIIAMAEKAADMLLGKTLLPKIDYADHE